MTQPDGTLRVGAAEVDITPAMGTHMSGDACRLRPVEKVLDPIYVRALVVESGEGGDQQRLCLLCLDLCVTGREAADLLRESVAEEFGFAPEAVMFHLLQNHSAPALGTHLLLTPDSPYASPDYWWTCDGDPEYAKFLTPKVLEVVRLAVDRLEPVSMACSGRADGRVAFNRRFVMRDGWVQTQANDLSQILHPEGPADPEVGVACFKNAAGRTTAALLHHTGHPVSYFSKNWVTASWPGAWIQQFRQTMDDGCVAMVVNGCCGNVNVRNNLVPGYETNDALVGEWLTESAGKALAQASWQAGGPVAFASHKLDIPFEDIGKTVGPKALARAREILAAEPEVRWRDDDRRAVDIEWLFAACILDIERRTKGKSYAYEVQAFRIGELGLIGLIGEPFVEGQLKIKLESPARRTFVAHMCNGYAGYIPTLHGHQAKSYNFRTPDGEAVRRGANLFLFVADALDRITSKSVELLDDLFARG